MLICVMNFVLGVFLSKKFKFSIILTSFNVEQYIRESIESVINQDIGFEENVQLIIVDDGSSDNSLNPSLPSGR